MRTRTQQGREFISHLKIRLFFLSCRVYLLPNLKRLSRETFSLKSFVLLMYNRLLIQGFLVLFFSASYHAPSPPVFDSRQHPVITSNPSVVRSTESLQARFSGNGEFIVSFYSTSRFCSLSLQVVVFIGTLIKFSNSLLPFKTCAFNFLLSFSYSKKKTFRVFLNYLFSLYVIVYSFVFLMFFFLLFFRFHWQKFFLGVTFVHSKTIPHEGQCCSFQTHVRSRASVPLVFVLQCQRW